MKRILVLVLLSITTISAIFAEIIDHSCTDITQIPESAINQAKADLHIAYGHTSHGSQLTDGMSGLIGFANGGGLGLSLPTDIFAWNNGGTGGALDLHDYAMGGDCGYYPQWYDNTVDYLENPVNSDVNVIIWSWCGQIDDKYAAGTLGSEYLIPMTQLEMDYPAVTFIYMTGHVDHWDDANNKAANQMVRDYCITNDKILYDFAAIESYDPDGTFFEFPHDNCNYYESETGPLLGNWATEWQNSHTVNVDWYNCNSAHSEPLNANRKAYAAWWLWATLAGWNPSVPVDEVIIIDNEILLTNYPNPFNPTTTIYFNLTTEYTESTELVIYNLKGQKVKSFPINQFTNSLIHQITWNGTNSNDQPVSSGIYFYKLILNGKTETMKKCLLLK
ncbi:MAG: T9SS type A sorting domain-containing protein [Candidatus Cloacimonadota bacterium]|nr:T9SS type A sorting domain-containing protein [Candidatus Cloacimonadota bacterium]